jgi:hypothetical protein
MCAQLIVGQWGSQRIDVDINSWLFCPLVLVGIDWACHCPRLFETVVTVWLQAVQRSPHAGRRNPTHARPPARVTLPYSVF